MKRKVTLLLVIGAFVVNSCKSDLGYLPTRTELLSKTWILMQLVAVSETVAPLYTKGANGNLTDLSKVQMAILPDGTYEQITPDGRKHSGNWSFNNNSTSLVLSDLTDNTVEEYRLAEIIAKHLTLKKVIDVTSSDATSAGYVQAAKALKLDPQNNGLEMSWAFMNK